MAKANPVNATPAQTDEATQQAEQQPEQKPEPQVEAPRKKGVPYKLASGTVCVDH